MKPIPLAIVAALCCSHTTPQPAFRLLKISPTHFDTLTALPWLRSFGVASAMVEVPMHGPPPDWVQFRDRSTGAVIKVLPLTVHKHISPTLWEVSTSTVIIPNQLPGQVGIRVGRGSIASNMRAGVKP